MTDVDKTNSANDRPETRTPSSDTTTGPDKSESLDASNSSTSADATPGRDSPSSAPEFKRAANPYYMKLIGEPEVHRSALDDNRASEYNLRGRAELQATRGWKEFSSNLAGSDWKSLPGPNDAGDRGLLEGRSTIQMRKMLSDRDAFRESIAEQLQQQFPNKSQEAIRQKTRAITREASHEFGRKVDRIIGTRAREMIDSADDLPLRVNESAESRRQFMAKLARRTDGDESAIRRGLANLGVGADRIETIASTLSGAHANGRLDELADPNAQGPDEGGLSFEGAYHNAEESLKAGLDETIDKFRDLRGQSRSVGDMKSAEYHSNLVNRNFNETRRAVLDQLDIGSLDDDAVSAEGKGAEVALREYRENLTSSDTVTERFTEDAKKLTYEVIGTVAGDNAKKAAELAELSVEALVAYQDMQLAKFASEQAGTANSDAVDDAAADLAELGAEEAASRAVEMVIPDPEIGPAGAPETIEEVQEAVAEYIYDEVASRMTDRLSESAGEATERAVEDRVRQSNL